METAKKVWEWVKINFRWVLFGLASLALLVLCIWVSSKNRKVRQLETDLAIMKAKLQVDSLAQSYAVATAELATLRKTEKELREKLEKIEVSLRDKLKEDMTTDEILAKFKELGF